MIKAVKLGTLSTNKIKESTIEKEILKAKAVKAITMILKIVIIASICYILSNIC